MHWNRRLAPLALALPLAAGCGGTNPTAPVPVPATTTDTETPADVGASELTGTLRGQRGAPMPMAHVTVDGEAFQVEADGSFRVPLPATGLARVQLTGVDHGDHQLDLLLDGRPHRVDVVLGTYDAPTSLDGATVVELVLGDDGLALGKTYPMTLGDDGTLRAEIATDAPLFAYELRGIVADRGRSMNGTARTEFRYDGDGNYANVVRPHDGVVAVAHDPGAVPPAGAATQVTFRDEASTTARVARVFEAMRRAAGDGPAQPAYAPAQLDAEADDAVRHAMIIAHFAALPAPAAEPGATRALAVRGVEEIPASSPLWKAAPQAALTMASSTGKPNTPYVEAVIEHLGGGVEAAELLFGLMWAARREGREDDIPVYYEMMMNEFRGTPFARLAGPFDPARAVRPGKPVPAFDLQSFDDPTQRYTPASFRGKTVMIEFWATWCGPCIAEMGGLHAAFERWQPRGFTILSINVDDGPDQVRSFRAGDWKLPWHHAVLDDEGSKRVKELFEVSALPAQLLIGPDGTILAIDPTLRGEGLPTTLTRVLGE